MSFISRLYQIAGTLGFCFYEEFSPFLRLLLNLLFFPYKGLLVHPPPERLRIACESLGPTFIKLGQMFSTRPDILPPEYIKELEKLQDKVPPVPLNHFKQKFPTFFLELEWIEENPVGSGSIAQVHIGILKGGQRVAVKFIKPGAQESIKKDLQIFEKLVKISEFLIPTLREMRASSIIKEMKELLLEEFDLTLEASYAETFKNFFKDKEIYVPKVFWEYTSKEILVMELVEGIKLTEIGNKFNRKQLASTFARAVHDMIFKLGIFHGDLHPGNIVVLEDGRIAFLDFGIVGRLTPTTMYYFFLFSLGVMEKDVDLMIGAFKSIGAIPEGTDVQDLKREMIKFLDKYYGKPLSRIDVQKLFYEELSLARKFKIVLPEELVSLVKAIVHTESIARLIYPEFTLPPILKPYLRKLFPKVIAKELKRKLLESALSIHEREEPEKEKVNLTQPAIIVGSAIVLLKSIKLALLYFLFCWFFTRRR
jgi:ubiquinone biosynthesis protein